MRPEKFEETQRNNDFINEEEISTAHKKYEAILNYWLSSNKDLLPKNIEEFDKANLWFKKLNFRDIVTRRSRYKAEIR